MSLPVQKSTISTDVFDIVRAVDLKVLTSKFVRGQLEEKYKVSFKAHKQELDGIIYEAIKKSQALKNEASTTPSSASNNNKEVSPPSVNTNENRSVTGVKRAASSPSPVHFDEEETDVYSAVKRRRAAQRPVQRKPVKKPKKTTEKTAKKNTAYTRICVLSDELSALLSRKYMRRSEVVKCMWDYFKKNDLLDPKDRRFVMPDEKLKAVIGAKRVQAFGMMKILKHHIKDVDFLDEDARRTAMHELEQLEDNGDITLNLPTKQKPPKSKAKKSNSSSSESEDDEPEAQTSSFIFPTSKPPTREPDPVEDSHTESATGVQRAKLVLRISKKDERMVSVAVKDETNGTTKEDNGASVSPDFGPPELSPEEPQKDDSPDSSSSSSSSGSSSSSSASSSPASSQKRNNGDELQLSESDSD